MQRFLLIVMAILGLLYTVYRLPYTVYADSQSALANYNQQYDLYRQNYSSYVTAKNKWLTYRTLDSNQEALINGKILLKQRVAVVQAYLAMLTERVRESPGGLSETDKNLIFSKINVEQAWLSEHLTKYDSAATLNDLQQLSGQFEDRYTGVIQYTALQTAGEILQAKESYLNSQLADIMAALEKTLPLVLTSGQDITVAQRWLLQAGNKNELAGSKQDDAITIISALAGQNPAKQYTNALFSLTESNQYLKETASYLQEVLTNIMGV